MALRLPLPLALPLALLSKPKTFWRPPASASQARHCPPAPASASSSSLRRSANYSPTIWQDAYIQSLPIDFAEEKHAKRREKLKEEVRRLIREPRGLITDLLELADALRQLGVAHHFDSEIKALLSSISSSPESISSLLQKNNLHGAALMFRLFREHGIGSSSLSADSLMRCFRKGHDLEGMMSLYEASYLAVEGEDELDEAGELAAKFLRNVDRSSLDRQLVAEIDHALELPLHWRMPRLHARWFIDVYGRREGRNPALLELAKLDFNMVQGVYRKELKEMSMWWRNAGFVCDELSFARDRLVEHYLWSTGFIFRPDSPRCRKAITKITAILTIIDDIYDVYGTMEELELFTSAIQRWKVDATEQLPEYMKICLSQVFKTVNGIAAEFQAAKGFDVLPCLKRVLEDVCKAYLVEARWYHTGCTPPLEEYLENAWVSISGACELTAAYCLSDELTSESLNSLEFYPPIARISSMLFRLYDDLGTAREEIARGDVPKSIQCYMVENGVSEPEARDYIKSLIRKYWKELNGIYFETATKHVKPFQEAVVDVPRMAQCFYQHGDGHGEPNPVTRHQVVLLLIEPITL